MRFTSTPNSPTKAFRRAHEPPTDVDYYFEDSGMFHPGTHHQPKKRLSAPIQFEAASGVTAAASGVSDLSQNFGVQNTDMSKNLRIGCMIPQCGITQPILPLTF